MDRIQAMSIFIAVVDEGGFAPAARKLAISPPVVTRAVAWLESAMGVRLLTRTTRVVRVTDVGARYASDCRRASSPRSPRPRSRQREPTPSHAGISPSRHRCCSAACT